MSDDFEQTVDLKKRFGRASAPDSRADKKRPSAGTEGEKARPARAARSFEPAKKQAISPGVRYGQSKRAEKIERVYDDREDKKFDYKKIIRPEIKKINEPMFRAIVIALGVILVGAVLYGFIFRKNNNQAPTALNNEAAWYAVKLINNETYYGQITDVAADPVVISNVYYDYDQLGKDANAKTDTNNLRLVKRGKEAYGPEGTMDIVRSQVVYMEPLSQDSKVLKAILDYEK